MLNRQNLLVLLCSLGVAVLLAGLIVVNATSFNECMDHTQKTYQAENQKSLDKGRAVAPFTLGYARCSGLFIYENHGAITALSTVLLAAITFGILWLGFKQSETSRAELRAYLSVTIGAAVFQDHAIPLRFEGKPTLRNNGKTPAYNVRYIGKADIIPDSLVDSYVFSVSAMAPIGQASVGPKEDRLMSCIVPHFVPDSEVQGTKEGNGKALWVWGLFTMTIFSGRPIMLIFANGYFGSKMGKVSRSMEPTAHDFPIPIEV